MRKFLAGVVIVMASLFVMSVSIVSAQDACEGNFDCDQDVDGTDAAVFKSDFGRSAFKNPCPPCTSDCDPPAPLPKTGQNTVYGSRDDGYWQQGLGVEWPNPRFTDNLDGTITDNLTGLIWLKDAHCFLGSSWEGALSNANGLASGACGLTDGSSAGDWRLPNINELASLVHKGYYNVAIPDTLGSGQWSEGDPFVNVVAINYWSSTTYAENTDEAWSVNFYKGDVLEFTKSFLCLVWPVRREQ
jgi:hypothetical protein